MDNVCNRRLFSIPSKPVNYAKWQVNNAVGFSYDFDAL